MAGTGTARSANIRPSHLTLVGGDPDTAWVESAEALERLCEELKLALATLPDDDPARVAIGALLANLRRRLRG